MRRRPSSSKALGRFRRHPLGQDEAVSPVIAEILLVVIAVVLAAGGYLWFSGLTDEGPKNVERVGFDVSRAGTGTSSDASWAKVTLIHDDRDERAFERMFITWQSSEGETYYKDVPDEGILCESAQARLVDGVAVCAAGQNVIDSDKTHWAVGETYYLPCQAKGKHALTISVQQQTVLDTRVLCDRAAS